MTLPDTVEGLLPREKHIIKKERKQLTSQKHRLDKVKKVKERREVKHEKDKVKVAEKKEDSVIVRNKYSIDTTEPTPSDSIANALPLQAIVHYGCFRCEWRGTWMCRYGFKSGRGYALKDNSHTNGICPERKNYLLSFSRGYQKRPSFAVWHKDFLMGQASYQVIKDKFGMEEIEQDLNDMFDNPPTVNLSDGITVLCYTEYKSNPAKYKDVSDIFKSYETQIKRLKGELREKRREWHSLWKDVVAVEDRQIDREQPKKVEIEHHRSIPLAQMHEIMRGDIIDVDVTEEEEVDDE